MNMKHALLFATAILFLTAVFASAAFPLDNINSAVAAAWDVIDQGKAKNYETDAIFTRDQLDLLGVEYRLHSSQRRTEVTFTVQATVEILDGTTKCKVVTIYFDDNGAPQEGIGYGDASFSDD